MIPQEVYEFSCKMLKHKVKQVELCQKLGFSATYVNEVLNGKRPHENALKKFTAALDELIAEKGVTSK